MLSCHRFPTTHLWHNVRRLEVPFCVWMMDRIRDQHRQCRTHTWVWAVHRWWINCKVYRCSPQQHRPHHHKTHQLVNRLAEICHNNSLSNSQMVIWKRRQVLIQMPPPTRLRMMFDRNDNHNVNQFITLKTETLNRIGLHTQPQRQQAAGLVKHNSQFERRLQGPPKFPEWILSVKQIFDLNWISCHFILFHLIIYCEYGCALPNFSDHIYSGFDSRET